MVELDKLLHQRLSEIDAAGQLGDLKFGKPHPLKGKRKEEYAVTVLGGCRIIFKNADNSRNSNENFDWKIIKKVNIIYIGDYHE